MINCVFPPVAKSKVRCLRIKSERKIELGKAVCKLSLFSPGVLNKDTDRVGVKMVSGWYRWKNYVARPSYQIWANDTVYSSMVILLQIAWWQMMKEPRRSAGLHLFAHVSLNSWEWTHNLPFKCSLVWKSTSYSLGLINTQFRVLCFFCFVITTSSYLAFQSYFKVIQSGIADILNPSP